MADVGVLKVGSIAHRTHKPKGDTIVREAALAASPYAHVLNISVHKRVDHALHAMPASQVYSKSRSLYRVVRPAREVECIEGILHGGDV
jgi:hypothetical protein